VPEHGIPFILVDAPQAAVSSLPAPISNQRREPFIVPSIPVMPGLVGDDFEVARGAPTTMLDHILFL